MAQLPSICTHTCVTTTHIREQHLLSTPGPPGLSLCHPLGCPLPTTIKMHSYHRLRVPAHGKGGRDTRFPSKRWDLEMARVTFIYSLRTNAWSCGRRCNQSFNKQKMTRNEGKKQEKGTSGSRLMTESAKHTGLSFSGSHSITEAHQLAWLSPPSVNTHSGVSRAMAPKSATWRILGFKMKKNSKV